MKNPLRSGAGLTGFGCLVALLSIVPSMVHSQDRDFPLASTGDIWFQVDHAGFLGDDHRAVEEYYFRVTNNQLQFNPEGDGHLARIFVTLEFRDGEDKKLGEASQRFEFTVDSLSVATSPDYAQLLVVREPLHPRAHTVKVTMEDLNARKRGLLYMLTGSRKNGVAKGVLDHPPFVGQEFGISDIQFAWEVKKEDEGSHFEKHGFDVIPNPSRNYGLLQPNLTAYYEVYDLRDLGDDSRTYFVYHELEGPDGNLTRGKPDTVESATGEWIRVVTFDLSQVPTGEHTLRAVIRHPDSGVEVSTERNFSVLWRSEFWEMTERDILDEARVLFAEDEYNLFKSMSAGDRAEYIEKFWADGDPSPNSARNELREEFLRRVGHANWLYSANRKGMLTDRGRIYIRFGPPDEILEEVMPTQGTQLDQWVPYLTLENPQARTLAATDVADTRAYEIWVYTRQGTPLFPERELGTPVTGLRFVFVDETGTGSYILRYQSDFIGY